MPEAASLKKGKEVNTIHQNEIWRQTIKKELNCCKDWELAWGFLKGDSVPVANNNSIISKKQENPYSLCVASKLGPGLVNGDSEHDAKLDSFMFTHNINKIRTLQAPNEKLSFPSTTSEQIGWQWDGPAAKPYGISSSKFYTLEKFGRLG